MHRDGRASVSISRPIASRTNHPCRNAVCHAVLGLAARPVPDHASRETSRMMATSQGSRRGHARSTSRRSVAGTAMSRSAKRHRPVPATYPRGSHGDRNELKIVDRGTGLDRHVRRLGDAVGAGVSDMVVPHEVGPVGNCLRLAGPRRQGIFGAKPPERRYGLHLPASAMSAASMSRTPSESVGPGRMAFTVHSGARHPLGEPTREREVCSLCDPIVDHGCRGVQRRLRG